MDDLKRDAALLARILGVEPGTKSANCPFHDDINPSLSLYQNDQGHWRFKCHGCGVGGTVVDALAKRDGIEDGEAIRRLTSGSFDPAEKTGKGVEGGNVSRAEATGHPEARPDAPEDNEASERINLSSEPKRAKHKGRIVKTYPYHDGEGNLQFEVCRLKPKGFSQRQPDGNGGWIWNVKGLPRLLYRLPELIAAGGSEPVFVPEGEKDVEALRGIGLTATCNPGGAGKWVDDDSALHGRSVVLVPDADEAGRGHAAKVAGRLHGKAASVKILDLRSSFDGFVGKDPADLLGAEGPFAGQEPEAIRLKILQAAESTPVWVPDPRGSAGGCDLTRLHLTDTGNAEAFAALHGHRVRFDHRKGRWLVFRPGLWWQEDADGEIQRMAKETVRARLDAANADSDSDRREQGIKRALASESKNRLDAMMDLAKSETPVSDNGRGWDADPWLLGTANGVVDLRTGSLRPGRPEDRITLHADLDYDPDAEAPRWTRFIEEVFGGDDLAGFVQRAAGYSLTGVTREQVLFVAYGGGANGKSVFLGIVQHVLGPLALNAPFSAFDHQARQSIPSDIAAFDGIRFVSASESAVDTRLNEDRVKALTGGDSITARFMYREYFTFVPVCKIWLATNHRPRVDDDSYGFWRRVRLVPFTKTFSGKQADPRLPDKLKREAEGILAWMVRGCLQWIEHGLALPAEVEDATRSWEDESDGLADFIEDCCVTHPGAKAPASELYASYGRWADKAGLRGKERITSTTFGRRMGKRFEKRRVRMQGTRPWVYLGVGLLPSGSEPEDGSDPGDQADQVEAGFPHTFPISPCLEKFAEKGVKPGPLGPASPSRDPKVAIAEELVDECPDSASEALRRGGFPT